MSSRKRSSPSQIQVLRPVTSHPIDAKTASMIEILQEHLALARAGQLRSLAVVSVSSDGASVGTQWSCAKEDSTSLIAKLAVLTHDMMASRK